MKKIAILLFMALALMSCENSVTKNFGGKMIVNIPVGQKLVNATWKNDDFWYLTRNMTSRDTAETYTFQEKSNSGIFQGVVIIIEHK